MLAELRCIAMSMVTSHKIEGVHAAEAVDTDNREAFPRIPPVLRTVLEPECRPHACKP